MPIYRSLITQLDQRPIQIEISVTILMLMREISANWVLIGLHLLLLVERGSHLIAPSPRIMLKAFLP